MTIKFLMEETESVWNIIVEHVPESELSEIRVLLGDALIDIYTEMYSEVTMWQQIWQTLRLKQGNRPKAPRSPLSDPPAIKELLKAEIQLLLATVRERAAQEGRSCSQSSVTSTTNQDDIDAMRHMLNITHIDDIVAHLKSVLSEECNVLKSQVQFLQESVEQEHQTQHDVTEAPEPTVTELKEERRAIQMDMKRQSLSLTHCPSSSPVETSLQIRSRSTGWTGFPVDETQRHLIPVVATRPHPPHTKPPLVTSLVRSTPPLDRMRGQPRSSPNTREPSPLQLSKYEQLRTYSQSSEASHTCNRGPTTTTTTQDRDSYLPPLVLSASTLTSLEPYLNPPSKERVKGRTYRRSGQTVTEGAQRHDDSWSDSVNSWPSLSSGGHSPLGSSTQPPGSKGSCEQMSPVRMFHPAPPAMQRPASRGQSVARHMCLPQRDSLVSSL
ncbi:serine/arginine repetitive matrix protein 2-like isoform X3 [Oncorhynchus clarkii lewisi]|uniref:serine/arginine repetitive matrix protein 2-like isoform X3 n=1 Tax=Oncorhynchus clarkii lewisi TaxID=490388 RepID=UPI0039B9610D